MAQWTVTTGTGVRSLREAVTMSDSSSSFSSSSSTVTPRVLLATSAKDPDGEPAHEVLDAALAQRGITSAWAPWDDPFVDWSAADLVAVRSTWDYDTRRADFLGWAREVGPHLLHGPELFRWNTDKAYLLDLAGVSGLRVVPTVVADNLVDVRAAIGRVGTAVVKPRHGAGGRGIVIVRDSESWLPVDQGRGSSSRCCPTSSARARCRCSSSAVARCRRSSRPRPRRTSGSTRRTAVRAAPSRSTTRPQVQGDAFSVLCLEARCPARHRRRCLQSPDPLPALVSGRTTDW